jgi:hypothetical protein
MYLQEIQPLSLAMALRVMVLFKASAMGLL